MTIYRLYQDNGHRAGFWIQHRSWSNACAQVISVAGRDSGRLPGMPPRHGDAAVVMLMFDIRSGRPLRHAEADDGAPLGKGDVLRLDPGDRQYTSIAEPSWHADRRYRGMEESDPDPRVETGRGGESEVI